jgi:zinc protease
MTSIRFGCNPENVDDLIQTSFDVINKMKQEGPDPKDLASVKEMHLRRNETTLRDNGFWLGALGIYARNDIDFDAVNHRNERANALTPEMIRQATIKYFDETNLFISKLMPEKDS